MRTRYHLFRAWFLEALAIIVAISVVAAIASILAVYNGKPVPDLCVNPSLKVLLALPSTVLRALLVVIVADIIAQQKTNQRHPANSSWSIYSLSF
jgi:hypothetical protein